MHVLMLGWEFPPFITGGLGTACHGLTKGLVQRGVKVTFVLPRSVATAESSHVELVSPEQPPQGIAKRKTGAAAAPATGAPASQAGRRTGARWIMVIDEHGEPRPVRIDVAMADEGGLEGVEFIGVPAASTDDPYASMDAEGRVITRSTGVPRPGTPVTLELPGPEPGTTIRRQVIAGEEIAPPAAAGSPAEPHAPSDASVTAPATAPATGPEYGGDLFTQIERYANFCVEAAAGIDFDVIHAHDWMTFPAGLALARATGRPLVVHVHSTEFDRSGVNIHQAIYDVERRGMHGALRVVAVSQLTRNVIVSRYGMPRHLVEVVYNGVDLEPRRIGMTGIRRRDKIVLYFGRITYQKGPEYFVAAAKRVLEILEDVKFVVAGSGDMAQRMIELAAEMGIGHKMLFTGFLR
ncbi:MAG: glycosyltransferase family 4 protein, partial [Planctomycetota bacterium]